jgi:hypothetical protein
VRRKVLRKVSNECVALRIPMQVFAGFHIVKERLSICNEPMGHAAKSAELCSDIETKNGRWHSTQGSLAKGVNA